MAIPTFDKKYIAEAIKYIDEHGVPQCNRSTRYELVWDNGNKYPPKYVIAVAHHLADGAEIDISRYNAIEAKNILKAVSIIFKQSKRSLS